MSSYFSRDKRLARRAERLSTMDKVSETLPGRTSGKLTTQNAGLQAVTMVRDMFNNYVLPRSPALSYSGIRGARKASDSSRLEDGVVTVYAEFKTPSGVNVGLEVPVEIRHGELLEPSIVVHDGAPRVIAQSTFDDIVSRSCLHEELPVRALYSAPMDKAHAERLYGNRTKIVTTQPGMFKLESAKEVLQAAVRGTAIKAEYDENGEWIKPWEKKKDKDEEKDKKEAQAVTYDALCKVCKHGYNSQMSNPKFPGLCERCAYMMATTGRIDMSKLEQMDMRDQMGMGMMGSINDKQAAKDHWDTATSERSKDLDKEQHPKKPEPDRNEQKLDWLDPAERYEQHDLGPGDETTLKEGLEYRERGGTKWDLPAGKKCTILRDHAGDNKSFVVRFDDGLEAIVERHFLKGAAKQPRPSGMKPPKPKKQQTQEPWKYKNKFKRNPKKKDAQGGHVEFNTLRDEIGKQETGTLPEQVHKLFADHEFIAKVNQELSQLHSDGVSEIDAKLAIKSKYGDDVMNAVFEKFGPDDQ